MALAPVPMDAGLLRVRPALPRRARRGARRGALARLLRRGSRTGTPPAARAVGAVHVARPRDGASEAVGGARESHSAAGAHPKLIHDEGEVKKATPIDRNHHLCTFPTIAEDPRYSGEQTTPTEAVDQKQTPRAQARATFFARALSSIEGFTVSQESAARGIFGGDAGNDDDIGGCGGVRGRLASALSLSLSARGHRSHDLANSCVREPYK
mmetsp:Transcript_24456/g.79832  ORF Transcript_24456/g.79832 Transcript_24456/m.79832 type:complete len:211 (-) Transcript_24456:47-679(-)